MRNRQRILVGLQARLGISRWTVQPRLLRRAREDRRHAPVVGARGFRIGAIDHIHYLVGRHSDHRAGFDAGAVLLDRNIPQPDHAEHGLRLSGRSRAACCAAGGIDVGLPVTQLR